MDRPLEREVGATLSSQLRRTTDLVDLFAGSGLAGGVGEHGDPRFDPEEQCRIGGARRDVRQLFCAGSWIDCAVAIDEYAVFEAHQEDARDHRDSLACSDELECRADRMCCRVCGAGNHSIRTSLVDHHGSEITHVGHDVIGHLQSDAFVASKLGVELGEFSTHL